MYLNKMGRALNKIGAAGGVPAREKKRKGKGGNNVSYTPGPNDIIFMPFDSTPNSTDFTNWVDLNNAWTGSGDGKITNAEAYSGSTSLHSQLTDDSAVDDGTVPALGTGDWLIEFWAYSSSFAGTQMMYDSRPQADGAYPTFYLSSTTIRYWTGGTTRINTTHGMSLDTWNHLCVSRASGTTRIFVNGVQRGVDYVDGTNYLASVIYFGRNSTFNGQGFIGYLDDFRVAKGEARSGSFTPPAAFAPD